MMTADDADRAARNAAARLNAVRAVLAGSKCDAPKCGYPAEVGDRLGQRFCTGHAYLAHGIEPSLRSALSPEVRRDYGDAA